MRDQRQRRPGGVCMHGERRMNIAAVTSSRLCSRVRKARRKKGWHGWLLSRRILVVTRPRGNQQSLVGRSVGRSVPVAFPIPSPFQRQTFIIFQRGAPPSSSASRGAEERSCKNLSSKFPTAAAVVRGAPHHSEPSPSPSLSSSSSSSMLYSASFDRLRPKSTGRKRRRSNGGGGGGGAGDGEDAVEMAATGQALPKSGRTASSAPSSSSSSSSQGSSGSFTKGFKKEYCRLKTLVPALSDREDLSKASAWGFQDLSSICAKTWHILLRNMMTSYYNVFIYLSVGGDNRGDYPIH